MFYFYIVIIGKVRGGIILFYVCIWFYLFFLKDYLEIIRDRLKGKD